MAEPEPTAAHELPPPCPQCGGPKSSHRKFCSTPCQWASMRTRPTLTCKGCGQPFVQRRRGSKDANLYCGRSCSGRRKWASETERRKAEKTRWRERKRQRLGLDQRCQRCGAQYRSKTLSDPYCSAACRKPRRIHASRPCSMCSQPFVPHHGLAKFCSPECAKKTHKRHRPKGGRKDRHRARKAGVRYEWINRSKLFERDRWRCQVCGIRTPKRLRGKLSDNAPELDHRVPLAMGGDHTWANVQLACRRCNAMKAAHRVVGQLPLFERPSRGEGI